MPGATGAGRVRVTAATPAPYELPAVDARRRPLVRSWLVLGLLALVGSGLYSVLLVLARTPGINSWLPAGDFFRVALVVHVDLSVLVWFVAIAGMLWSMNRREARSRLGGALGWLALALAGAGALGMMAAAFADPGTPVMSNYIPMLDSATFRAAVAVFGIGVLLLVGLELSLPMRLSAALDGTDALRAGLRAAAVATAVALLAFGWSLAVVPAGLPPKAYYEILYWGGGHALQFTWTLLMLVGWLALANACGGRVPVSPRVALLLIAIALAGVFVTPLAYLMHDVVTVEHRDMHTWGMRAGGGLAILPMALAAVLALAQQARRGLITDEARPLRAALITSIALFASGGLVGLAIDGANVKIPAHYHGCIVGVTLALMGLVYHLLPRLGYGRPRGRLAVSQPWVYGLGQLMHITGLVWSGGYGVQRKVAGAEQVLRGPGEIFGMGLMGAGGAVAIAGGLLFVVVVWRAMHGAGR
ncbi:MAG: cbb3-type cytochrome c oxidase subunit I [Burkholderiales bacterium]|nr:cbb3-type cytochrome c oxidase subunit I [Burkholderiales bacterium]